MEDELYQKLLSASFRFVSFRPRSSKELRDFLTKKIKRYKVFSGTLVTNVLHRLAELGYLDDEKFAVWWVEQRTGRKPKGKRAIEFELRQKGISKSVIESAIRTRGVDEGELARKLLFKKSQMWRKLPTLDRKRKMFAYLFRRGFFSETIETIVDEATEKEYNEH